MASEKPTATLWNVYEANGYRDNVGALVGHVASCELEEDADHIVACVNAFHSEDGRTMENIPQSVVWRLVDTIERLIHGVPELLEGIGYQDEEDLVLKARTLLDSLNIRSPAEASGKGRKPGKEDET